jgi:hypothetical protein
VSEPTFHAGAKLAWHEQVMIDRAATRFQLAVVVAITRRLNGRGEAVISQDTIANIVGASERGVRKALEGLQDLGHLKITSRGNGRGCLATYQPVIKRRNGGSSFAEPERRNGCSQKGGTAVHGLFIQDSHIKIPCEQSGMNTASSTPPQAISHNQTVTELPHRPNALAGRWRAMKDCVAETYGSDLVHSWLDKLTLEQIDGSALVLTAPTKFIARHIEGNFAEKIIAAWRHTGGDAGGRDVRVLFRHQQGPASAAAPTSPANDIALCASPELREASA